MTKKDYVAIAQIIEKSTSWETTNSIVKSKFILALCKHFEVENPKFDSKKFKDACRCPVMDKIDSY